MRRFPFSARSLAVFAAAAAALCGAAAPAQALTIVPVFDASVTSLSNASAVESAFRTVANDYARSFSNPVTVNVGVSWGSVAGQSLPSSAVGASVNNLYGYFTYSQMKSYLQSSAASNPSDTALATAVRSLPSSAPAGPSRYVVPSAEAKALGLISGSQSSLDGSIGFAGSTSGYDFNPTDGINAGAYDFEAVAAHEMAEILGRISGIASATPTYRTAYDLFRDKAPGVISYGYNDAAYFSIDGGVTDLKNFNNSSSGGDRGDWQTLSTVLDVSNAFISTGRRYNISAVDLTSLDVLGWGGSNLGDTAVGSPNSTAFALVNPDAAPEPAQWLLMIAGFGLTGATLRRRRGAIAAARATRQ
jgi:hypothetical protein